MSDHSERLAELLPAVYRLRDAALAPAGSDEGPLTALLGVVGDELAILDEGLAQLYDDLFIETCAEWVVPYIGDLLGVRGLHQVEGAGFSERAYVANTIAYRRRKGTASVLEQLARDVTGWDARAVEFFQLLATTQHLNHIRPAHHGFAGLRDAAALELLDGPFDAFAHTADVRRAASRRGRYNLPNVGIFLWPLAARSLTRSPAARVDARRFAFSPLGDDTPLVTLPETEDEIKHLAEPVNVPLPISRRRLAAHLTEYYGSDRSIFIEAAGPVAADAIQVCDLRDVLDAGGNPTWAHLPQPGDPVAVDPVLGRLAFPSDPGEVLVTFHYAFGAALGGGEYDRAATFARDLRTAAVTVRVGTDPATVPPNDAATIQAGLDLLAARSGVVEITDSGRYTDAVSVTAAAGQEIELRAADGVRPALILPGPLTVAGGVDAAVTLNGLLIAGAPVVVSGAARAVTFAHCTLVPGLSLGRDGQPEQPEAPSLTLAVDAGRRTLMTVEKCITGPLRLPRDGAEITIRDSIVDAPRTVARTSRTPALISAALTPFPALGAGPRAVLVTIGGEGPHRVALGAAPADLAGAAAALMAGIAAARPDAAFAATRVLVVEDRLVIVPGVPAAVAVADDGSDGTASALGLTPDAARSVLALVSGRLPAALPPRPGAQSISVTVGDEGPFVATLNPPPTDPATARSSLQAALRAAAGSTAFTAALVGLIDDRLLVLPGVAGAAVVVGGPAGGTALADLALETAVAALAASAGGERPGPSATLERSTFFGAVHVRELPYVSDVIFVDPVVAERRQVGCLRFSFVPPGSQTPRRFRCQPVGDATGVRPAFAARRFGRAAYAQLSRACPVEIRAGGSGDSEMGAYHHLGAPLREANLRARLDEYLRFALEAGIFVAT